MHAFIEERRAHSAERFRFSLCVCVAGETRINYSNVFALCEHVTLFCTSFRLARSLCRLNVFLASYWHLVHICANIRLLSAPYATTCEVRVRERL